jgi:tryptophan synthase alpha chain
MNRIQNKLSENKKVLSIYITIVLPRLNDTKSLI